MKIIPPLRRMHRYLTPGTIFLLILYATTITAAPIYMLSSLSAAIKTGERFCATGVISTLRDDAPHIIATVNSNRIRLTLPTNPLSIKKRVYKDTYNLKEGDVFYFCRIEYQPFNQNFITLLQKDDETLIDEATAAEKIKQGKSINSLIALNICSYLALILYAIKFRREK